MVLNWLKARDAVDAGAALADSFPAQTTGGQFRAFIDRGTVEMRALKLGFYKPVRFANAFKWRLLEKCVAAETAHDVTQTLLIRRSRQIRAGVQPLQARKRAAEAARQPL